MKRYFAITQKMQKVQKPLSSGWWDYDAPLLEGRTVYEPDSLSPPTGLYDAEGRELYSSTNAPLGFIHPRQDD